MPYHNLMYVRLPQKILRNTCQYNNVFRHNLFNKSVNSSGYTASNDKLINKYWVWKDTEICDCSIKYYHGVYMQAARETTKKTVRIFELLAKIWKQDLASSNQECQALGHENGKDLLTGSVKSTEHTGGGLLWAGNETSVSTIDGNFFTSWEKFELL
jgi:hypothetical protein